MIVGKKKQCETGVFDLLKAKSSSNFRNLSACFSRSERSNLWTSAVEGPSFFSIKVVSLFALFTKSYFTVLLNVIGALLSCFSVL